jgi:hypothetical protein
MADIKHTQMILDKDTYYHQLCVCVCEQSGCTTLATVRGGSLEVEGNRKGSIHGTFSAWPYYKGLITAS